jgi:nucleoside recognition membrane protein YjiH
MLGIGMNVLTRTTADVGNWGVVAVFVIAVGGTGCIGAYFVSPVWDWYGIAQAPASALEAAGFTAPARALTDGGGDVSVTAAFP